MIETFTYCPRCATALTERDIPDDGGVRIRMACANAGCGFVQWHNPTPAIGALVEHEGDIILARNAAWTHGAFALITGYLEKNEDPKDCAVREVKEELNLDVTEIHLIGNYIFERKNEVMLCYHVIATGEIKLSEELAEYRRYQPHELRPWPSSTGYAVADWMRARNLKVEFMEFVRPQRATES